MATRRSSSYVNAGIGLVLIFLGALFLVGQFFDFDFFGSLWPFFIIIPGLVLFAIMFAGGRSAGAMAIPASVVTTVGLILLYQNTFNHFESWSYAWALMPTSVGIGLMIQGRWGNLPRTFRSGRDLARIGLIMFVAFGIFFELIINISNRETARYGFPVLLILLGAYLLLRRASTTSRQEPAVQEKSPPAAEVDAGLDTPPVNAGDPPEIKAGEETGESEAV